MTLTTKNYNRIAHRVYDLDLLKDVKEQDRPIKGSSFEIGGQTYEVIDTIGNSEEPTDNGLQAMAVAPVNADGSVDYSQVVVADAIVPAPKQALEWGVV